MPKLFLAAALAASLGAAVSGQTRSAIPRTPWGHPDLQGRWTNFTLTLVERPTEFGAKEYFTEAEAAEYCPPLTSAFSRRSISLMKRPSAASSSRASGEDRDLVPTRRTSLIVGPSGRVPPLTAAAQERAAARAAQRKARPADGPEDRALNERCLWFPVGGPPMLPGIVYNSHYEIVQTSSHVMILAELGNAVRIIPLDGRPHLPPAIRHWQGDSRGRFEGDILVVETTNFNDKVQFRGASEHLRLIERFKRTERDTIMCEFTASDPTSWTDSWTAEVPMKRLEALLFEYACHEGNRGLANIQRRTRRRASIVNP